MIQLVLPSESKLNEGTSLLEQEQRKLKRAGLELYKKENLDYGSH